MLNTNLLPTTNHNRILSSAHNRGLRVKAQSLYKMLLNVSGQQVSILSEFFLSPLRSWVRQYVLAAKVLVLYTLGSHMDTSSNPSSSTSHPAPCLWPEEAIEDGTMLWDPAPTWETQKQFLVPGFGSLQYQPSRSLGECIIGWKIFLSVSPPLLSDFVIKINKS